jgi:hypothetical protein
LELDQCNNKTWNWILPTSKKTWKWSLPAEQNGTGSCQRENWELNPAKGKNWKCIFPGRNRKLNISIKPGSIHVKTKKDLQPGNICNLEYQNRPLKDLLNLLFGP